MPKSANVRKMWQTGPVLDQGQDNDCTGFAWAALLMANPHGDLSCKTSVGNAYGRNHTERARQGIGPARVAVDRGAVSEYRWATTLQEVIDAVIGVGPVETSIPLYRSMWAPNRDGRLVVKRDRELGWHALVITGYDPAKRLGRWTGPAFKIRNSWGDEWGTLAPKPRGHKPWQRRRRTGDAWITCADFDRLMLTSDAALPGKGYDQMVCVPMGKTGARLADLLRDNPNPQVS